MVGAGGHGVVVAEALMAQGTQTIYVFDDRYADGTTTINGLTITGIVSELPAFVRAHPGLRAVVAIGDNAVRRRISHMLAAAGVSFATVIHPRAIVSPAARLEEGAMVMAGAVVNGLAEVGAHTIVNTSASVDHHCRLAPFTHIAPGAHLGGNVQVGEGALVGIGASIIPGCRIGRWSTIGAGAAVVDDVADAVVVAGVPARVIGSKKPDG